MVIERIARDNVFQQLLARLQHPVDTLQATGLWGSSAPALAAALAERTSLPLLYVTAHLEEADNAQEDIEFFGGKPCGLFPAFETVSGEGAASGEIDAERLRLCGRLARGQFNGVLVAPILALMQPVPTRETLDANSRNLATGDRIDPEELCRWFVERGFERLELVESPGDFALRGGIFDIFPPGEEMPIRIELFDDEIESMRRFDVSTQRSSERIDSLSIAAMPATSQSTPLVHTHFMSYLPQDTIVILDEPGDIQEMGTTLYRRINRPDELLAPNKTLSLFNAFKQLYLTRMMAPIGAVAANDSFRFEIASLSRFEGKTEDTIQTICDTATDHDITVVCDNPAEANRLRELLTEQLGSIPSRLQTEIGFLHRGFEWKTQKLVVIAHHEVFHRTRQRRRLRKLRASQPLETWNELSPGDLVVHALHGIARFVSMKVMQKGDSNKKEEYLTLEFAEQAVLHVPVSQIDLVQKYIGCAGIQPTLSKLGGTRWKKTRDKVSEAVTDLAESLIRVQAAREASEGIAYPKDTKWQQEFNAEFPYEETEDQLVVIEDVTKDLSDHKPMDRLLCGDVGFGKTEIAMRAAFKVVEYGKQVAVLVPTTVLAEQHYTTFRDRMADYPISIECLSRFRKTSEQASIANRASRGQVDIVIGTHRMLSQDVRFADLGLVIIDEEQRFGVKHKEVLRQMRETVDVLTLTATPIPRTLHMSLLGIRSISSLETPPVDRRSIATRVAAFDKQLIRSAILREMNRDGQVFFLHNYVQSIKQAADAIKLIVPEARVLIGHGQMKPRELEQVMTAFVKHKADVLVCTTIIETGIDIPKANTILINRADRFGLADMHQLRGRVGRSARQAYCYLLVSEDKPITPKARKRLKAVEDFSELGAGFRIAMRDLEIRGAGNILGPEQSGHISSVGYEMFCSLLETAVRRLRNEPDPRPKPVHLELDTTAHIPTGYIRAERSRIEIYRRVVSCRTMEELEQIEQDIQDAFGPLPRTVRELLDLAELRVLAAPLGITKIILQEPDVVFSVKNLADVDEVFKKAPGTARIPDPNTVHLRMPSNYLEQGTLITILRKILKSGVSQAPSSGLSHQKPHKKASK